jgi:hypothetical protein
VQSETAVGRICLVAAMIHTVEISLRIPSLRSQREGAESPGTIANNDVRFIKHVDFEALPHQGDVLTMTVGEAGTFKCEVVRSEWQNDKNMFVMACKYAKRSISEAEYRALMDAPDWQVRAIL